MFDSDLIEEVLNKNQKLCQFSFTDPMIFLLTLWTTYGRLTATDNEVIEAAKAANAHDFISGPEAYNSFLGEKS